MKIVHAGFSGYGKVTTMCACVYLKHVNNMLPRGRLVGNACSSIGFRGVIS